MIEFTFQRSDMMNYPSPVQQRKVSNAFLHMIFYEIGYGGYPVKISRENDRTRIVMHTPIFGHIDIVTMVGSKEDMDIFVIALMSITKMDKEQNKRIIEEAVDFAAQLNQCALISTAMSLWYAGTTRSRIALFVALAYRGIVKEKGDCEKIIKILKEKDHEEIFDLLFQGYPLNEVMTLLQ